MEKFRVTLLDEERTELQRLVTRGKGAARRLAHARILLLADVNPGGPGRTDADIVQALGCSVRTIERVRKRFVTESLAEALSPRPQPLRPDKIKIRGGLEQRLVQVACSDPPDGHSHWTLQLLSDEIVALGCQRISRETIRQALKKTTCNRGP